MFPFWDNQGRRLGIAYPGGAAIAEHGLALHSLGLDTLTAPGANTVMSGRPRAPDHWPGFSRFLEDGRVCLTNNAAGRSLRGVRQPFCSFVMRLSPGTSFRIHSTYPASVLIVFLGRVDKRDSQGVLNVIQAGICDGDQLGTRPDVGRGMGVSRALHPGRPRPERAQT